MIENETPYNILKELNENKSTNYKAEVLEKYKNNKIWTKVLQYTYNTDLNYFINKKIKYNISQYQYELSLDFQNIFDLLNLLSSGNVRGNKGIELFKETLENIQKENAEILELIIRRDLKAGISTTTLNKIYGKNFIHKTPYLGCQQFDSKKIRKILERDGQIYSEVKNDGRYANVILDKNIKIVSRQGKATTLYGHFISELNKLKKFYLNNVFNGELMVRGYDRLTGNALISRCISINENLNNNEIKKAEKSKKILKEEFKISFEEAQDKIYMIVWDIIPKENYNLYLYNKPRVERIKDLEIFFNKVKELKIDCLEMQEYKIITVPNFNKELSRKLFTPSKITDSKTNKKIKNPNYLEIDKKSVDYLEFQKNVDIAYQNVLLDLKEKLERGDEGTVLKSFPCIWREGKKEEQFKGKIEFNCELEIIGFKSGKEGTKYENTLGSLECKTSCGKIICNVSGIEEVAKKKDLSRDDFWNNKEYYLGKIITIKCNGISTDKEGNKNFFYPNYEILRTDKEVADSLEDILEIERGILSLKEEL